MSLIYEQPLPITTTSLSFSVIVCAYTEKRWDDLLLAVASLTRQTLPPLEIIIVIDHNPALLERTSQHFAHLPLVKVIENQGPRGLSGARNSGLPLAQGDIIAFMDEDAVAAPDWLAQLADMYQYPQVMGVGGAIRPNWASERPAWFPEEFDWVVGCTYRGMPTTKAPVRNLIGCNMSFRYTVCELNGSFRDGIGRIGTLPVGCEETEYCIRAKQRWPKRTLMYTPLAEVFHTVPDQRATWRYFASRCYAEGVSKALISQFVGTSSSLAAETSYVLKTLPQGIQRYLTSAVRNRDINGLAQAAALVAGLGLTGLGYLKTRLTLLARQLMKPAATYTAAVSEKLGIF